MILDVKFEENSSVFESKVEEQNSVFDADFGEVVKVGTGSEEIYEGDYIITPKETAQVMKTAGKVMNKDVTVKEIPYYVTSNTAGGETVYIGKVI